MLCVCGHSIFVRGENCVVISLAPLQHRQYEEELPSRLLVQYLLQFRTLVFGSLQEEHGERRQGGKCGLETRLGARVRQHGSRRGDKGGRG